MDEIWKDILGYEGIYQVSTKGKVRGVSRVTKHPRSVGAIRKSKMLSLVKTAAGYLRVTLSRGGKRCTFCVHRLVAEAFISNMECKSQVNHKNGVKDDNSVDNLEWVTPKENVRHSIETGLNKCRGELRSKSVLTEQKVVEMRNLRTSGMQYNHIAELFHVSTHTARSACMGFTWKHVI
jgi:hypothetical protein